MLICTLLYCTILLKLIDMLIWMWDFAQDIMGTFNLKSQHDLYLDEPRKSIELKLDVITFWKENEAQYPIIAQMEKDILSVPITIVTS